MPTVRTLVDPSEFASLTLEFVEEPRNTIRGEQGQPSGADGGGPAVSTGGAAAVDALAALGVDGGLSLGETIGVGGMGVVRLGRQASIGREVAVKTLRSDRSRPGHRLLLLREAWITGRLEHPNIVPVHDVRLDADGAPQVVLKKVDGEVWLDLLYDRARLSAHTGKRDALAWHVRTLAAVCNAVEFAHSQGIIHRDIKPENVMIGAFGEVSLLDWGIAASLRPDPSGQLHVHRAGEPLSGTPAYMSPEMLGRQLQSEATDVYLLGAVLFEILAGKPPHHGPTVEAMLEAIGRGPTRPEGPTELVDLSMRAMSREESDRPSVSEFREGLSRFLERRALDGVVASALDQLQRLREAVRREDATAVAALFSACSFAFGHALQVWPEHSRARAGRDESLCVMARWALDRGELELAVHHLSQAEQAEPALVAEVAEGQSAAAEEAAATAALLSAYDLNVGKSSRAFMAMIFGLLGVTMPVAMVLIWGPPSYAVFAASSVGLILASLVYGVLKREVIAASHLNRRFFAIIVGVPSVQLLVDLGGWLRGWPPHEAHAVLLILLLMTNLAIAILLEWRLIFGVAVTGPLWLASAIWPETIYMLIPVATAGAIIIGLLAFRDQINTSGPERFNPAGRP